MARISEYYNLELAQESLDFVDVDLVWNTKHRERQDRLHVRRGEPT
jgi:hypothetical protein